jgi:hypothetical protein
LSSAKSSELKLSKLNAKRLCHFIFIILFLLKYRTYSLSLGLFITVYFNKAAFIFK